MTWNSRWWLCPSSSGHFNACRGIDVVRYFVVFRFHYFFLCFCFFIVRFVCLFVLFICSFYLLFWCYVIQIGVDHIETPGIISLLYDFHLHLIVSPVNIHYTWRARNSRCWLCPSSSDHSNACRGIDVVRYFFVFRFYFLFLFLLLFFIVWFVLFLLMFFFKETAGILFLMKFVMIVLYLVFAVSYFF
jgi:hypothetical protein